MSLSEHRGVACAPQLIISGGWNTTPTSRNQGYARYFPFEFGVGPKGEIATFPNGKVYVCIKGGPAFGNSTSEHITPFKVTESGTYRLTGSVTATEYYPGNIGLSQHQVAVISSNSSYLAGNSNYDLVITGKYLDGSGWTNRTYNETFTLSTSRPYACLILYSISASSVFGQTLITDTIASATFSNMRVVKE